MLWLTSRRSAINKRPGDTKTTAMVVIEGLTGKPVAEICTAHQISRPCMINGGTSFWRMRPRALRVVQHDEARRPRIQALQAAHPFWGDRRMWAPRRCVAPLAVNKTRRKREPRLLVTSHQRLQAQRTPPSRQPHPTAPNQWWGIDMTKVLVEGVGWVSLMSVLDGYTTGVGGP
jgi:hypothetical protein